jgi:hypothetical protein
MSLNNLQNVFAVGTVMDANLHGQAMSVQKITYFSFSVFFTGTPTGTFYLEGSNDPYVIGTPTNSNQAPTHWSTIQGTSIAVSAAGDVSWDYGGTGYQFVRVSYTDGSSGASNATITWSNFNGK